MVDVPDVSPLYAPVVIAQVSQAQEDDVKADRTVGVCNPIGKWPDTPLTQDNDLDPIRMVGEYFEQYGTPPKVTGVSPWKVSVSQGPRHGRLEVHGPQHGGPEPGPLPTYVYHPTPNYFGPDRATLLVEIGGYKVKVMYFLTVLRTVSVLPSEDRKNCPKGALWKISLNPNGPNHGLITFLHLTQNSQASK